jgi:alpha-L-rhamnosidase
MRKLLGIVVLQIIVVVGYSQIKVDQLLCENRINPIGLDNALPHFTWTLISKKRNAMQAAYEIRVSNASKDLKWNSGKIQSARSVHVSYGGASLESDIKYFWQVKVWDNNN